MLFPHLRTLCTRTNQNVRFNNICANREFDPIRGRVFLWRNKAVRRVRGKVAISFFDCAEQFRLCPLWAALMYWDASWHRYTRVGKHAIKKLDRIFSETGFSLEWPFPKCTPSLSPTGLSANTCARYNHCFESTSPLSQINRTHV